MDTQRLYVAAIRRKVSANAACQGSIVVRSSRCDDLGLSGERQTIVDRHVIENFASLPVTQFSHEKLAESPSVWKKQLGAKTVLFGKLTADSKFATSPSIEVYCLVNEQNQAVGLQVHPTRI